MDEIRQQFESNVKGQLLLIDQIQEKTRILQQKEIEFRQRDEQMAYLAEKAKSMIKFNVGGKLFATSKQTIINSRNPFFMNLIQNDIYTPESDFYFIDRNPKFFNYILDYLRYQKIEIDFESKSQKLFMDELDYYEIDRNVVLQTENFKQQSEPIDDNIIAQMKVVFSEKFAQILKLLNEMNSKIKLLSKDNYSEQRKQFLNDQLVKFIDTTINFQTEFFKQLQIKNMIEPINFEWDIQKSNNIRIDGLSIHPLKGCDTEMYILSKQTLPDQIKSYFEILRKHTHGCYDSIGLCIQKDKNLRNGSNANGWALRLHGQNKDTRFTGLIHNGASTQFFEDWEENDKIGVLYDPFNSTMSYYRNGKYLGTPFKNVKGNLYICVENCHLPGFSMVQNPKLPEELGF